MQFHLRANMADTESQPEKSGSDKLDLGSLQSLSLGPKWGSDKPQGGSGRKRDREHRPSGDSGHEGGGGRPARKDRKGFKRKVGDRPPAGRGERRPARDEREPFEPVVEVQFFPEEEPFKVLTQAVRNSLRTFELFEIARLILEKPERFVCVVKDPRQQEGGDPLLFASVPDGLPFRSEEEALHHVFQHRVDAFFDTEEVEVEPPSGSFTMVHRCGLTGKLIGPPNYHRYGALCVEHHSRHLAHLPFAQFKDRLESVKEPEVIEQWLEQMKKQTRYTLKLQEGEVRPEGQEALQFSNLEDARLYLVANSKDKLVRPAYSARFSGKDLALLPAQDLIRRSIDFHLQRQLRFPLDTANHLRGRLRKLNFAVYKKGSKGVSYVCAVKRRFRQPDEKLADNLEDLIAFIEAHPEFPVKNLAKGYLGIEIDPAKPDSLDKEAAQRFQELKRDLRYLISEGYVIEFSDGRLFVPPPKEAEKPKKKPEAAARKPQPTESAAAAEQEKVEPVVETEAKVEAPTEAEEPATEDKEKVKPVIDAESKAETPAETDETPAEPKEKVEPIVETEALENPPAKAPSEEPQPEVKPIVPDLR